jgi:hypothetical protein
MNVAHHMFAFGCDKPAVTLSAWNCESQVCLGEKSILFAWGRNAPKLDLPDGKQQACFSMLKAQDNYNEKIVI